MSELAELKLDMLLKQVLDLKGEIKVLRDSLGTKSRRISIADLARNEGISYVTAKKKYRDLIIKGSSPACVDFK